VLHSISWQLRPGENWAVVGANGSGKSTFLKLIRGDLWPEPTRTAARIYCLEGECQETPLCIGKSIGLVDPDLQDGYTRNGIDISAEDMILTGFFDSVWLHEKPSPSMVRAARRLISLLELEGLRKRSILTMSRGEARKVLIARALVFKPRIVLMDEVFNGLDSRTRKQLFGLLEKAAGSDTQFVLATHRMSDLGPFITHAAMLKEGRIVAQGTKNQVLRPGASLEAPRLNVTLLSGGRNVAPTGEPRVGLPDNKRSLIKMSNVSVYIDDKNVLRGIDWEMKGGENWAVLGKNGAGKSTFLRLISGYSRPAAGGEIRRFGRRSSESVWDLRKKIGYVSPELQAEYDENMTGEDVVASGFFSSIGLYRRVPAAQRRLAEEVMGRIGIGKLRCRHAHSMSYGEFRKVLIARALVKGPALLLLDEPFGGLDSSSKKDFTGFLDKILRDSVRVILVTHHTDEVIPSISHILVLDRGRIAAQGRREDILGNPVLSALHLD